MCNFWKNYVLKIFIFEIFFGARKIWQNRYLTNIKRDLILRMDIFHIVTASFFLPFPKINPRRASRTRNRSDNASGFHGLGFSTIQPKAPFVGLELLPSHDVYGQAGPPARANQPETHVSTFARPSCTHGQWMAANVIEYRITQTKKCFQKS